MRLATLVVFTTAACGACVYATGEYHFRAAGAALDQDLVQEAARHLDWCALFWPRSYAVKLRQARVERLLEHFDACEARLQEAMAVHGGPSEETQLEFLLLRCQRGELDEVGPGLLNAAEQGGADAAAIYSTVIQILVREGRLPEALVCIDNWQRQDPENPAALDLRGYVEVGLNRTSEAISSYTRALELAPDRIGARVRLVDLYLQQLNPDAAEVHLRQLLATWPQKIAVRSLRARYLILLGQVDEACGVLDGIYAEDPQHIATLLNRAKVEVERGNGKEAETWARRLLALNPYDPEAHYTLYRSLHAQGNRQEEALEHKKRKETLQAAYEQINKMRQFSKLTALQHPDQMAELGRLYLEVGQEFTGLRLLFGALRIAPRQRAANETLAAYFDRHNEPEKARRHRQAAQ